MGGITFRHLGPAAALAALAGLAGCEGGGLRSGGAAEADRELTYVLVEYEGPEADASAERLARELRTQNINDVFVIEGAERSSVCVGRYDDWRDPKAKAMAPRLRAARDLKGRYPFAGVMLMPVPEPAPETRWELTESPGYFSLYVAGYEAPGRKTRAQAEAVRLRGRGHPAYVYHGPRLSMVTLGSYGPEIFDEPAKVGKPDVMPQVTDPEVLALQRQFPKLRLEGESTPVSTFFIKIPGKDLLPGASEPTYRMEMTLVGLGTTPVHVKAQGSGPKGMSALVASLLGTALKPVPKDRRLRVGLLGLLAPGEDQVPRTVIAKAAEAIEVYLNEHPTRRHLRAVAPETTARALTRADLSWEDLLRAPASLDRVDDVDAVLLVEIDPAPEEGP